MVVIMYYLNNFFLFSIFGFFFETLIFYIFNIHKYSGFLYLWWTPFYGSGVLITILLYNYLSTKISDKKRRLITLFILNFFILSLLEFGGGLFLEKLYGYPLWDYTPLPLNVGKHISVGTSLLWSVFSVLYILFIKEHSDKIVSKIPRAITIIVTIIFILDNILTISKLISIKEMLIK